MTLEEKIKFIEENKEKNYLYISPRIIQGGATLIDSYESLELYENMDDNTSKFAEKEIVNLISDANYNNEEAKSYLDFNLIFCGDFDDLPNGMGSLIDFIINSKERIVAVYRYVRDTEQRNFFVGFAQTETIYKYGYLYLSLAKLLEEFEKNNIKYEIDTTLDRYTPSLYRDDKSTKFVISYNPQKKLESENGNQLKKVRKELSRRT
ncbi:MAG: hypothetical protein ACI4U0_03485 [Candidatus Aphodocola sp.]